MVNLYDNSKLHLHSVEATFSETSLPYVYLLHLCLAIFVDFSVPKKDYVTRRGGAGGDMFD